MRKTPQHKEEIRKTREQRIDRTLFAFGLCVWCAVILMVFSAWQ